MKSTIAKLLLFLGVFTFFSFGENGTELLADIILGDVYTEENKAIPPDFGKDDSVVMLCVLKERNSYDRYLKKGVADNYRGKYEFVTEKELKYSRYKDTEKYMYVFDYVDNYKDKESGVTFGKMFFIKDRLNSVMYIREGQVNSPVSNFGKAIAMYMEALEKKRLSW